MNSIIPLSEGLKPYLAYETKDRGEKILDIIKNSTMHLL